MTRKIQLPQKGDTVAFPDGREIIINASQMAEMAERIERRITDSLEKIEARAEKTSEKQDVALEKLVTRVTDLEKWQSGIKPYIAAVAAILALLGGILSSIIIDDIKSLKLQVAHDQVVERRTR